jgi:hypothetical protein
MLYRPFKIIIIKYKTTQIGDKIIDRDLHWEEIYYNYQTLHVAIVDSIMKEEDAQRIYFPSESYLFYFVDHPVCILFDTLTQNGSFSHTIYSLSHTLGILFLHDGIHNSYMQRLIVVVNFFR